MPRVSVIMNVRNGAAHLREALQSVFDQTYSDFEVVVWDDRSTDDSARIVHEYEDPRVRYFLAEEDTSLGRARHLAIAEAGGEWLAFLDQDDIWLKDKLQKQMELASVSPRVGLVYGRTVMFTTRGRERDYDHRHEFAPLPEGDIFLRLFTDSCFIAMSSAMLRRSAVTEAGGIPNEIRVIPDYYLFVAVARRYEARAVQGVVCRYRLHGGSMSHFSRQTMHEEALWLIDKWAPELKADMAQRRRMIHSTVLAFEELHYARSTGRGLSRLLTRGSLSFLLSRPFARGLRALRRRIRRPLWRLAAPTRPPAALAAWPLELSVIVVNWNVRDLLRECLASLAREMRLPRDSWEVIVVDNASGDGSVEMVRREFPDAVVLANGDNLGFGRANNQAFRMCRGRYVLLLNPDTVVKDHAIDRMMETMDGRPDVAALGCRLLNTDGTFQRWTGGSPPGLLNVTCHFLLLYRLIPARLMPRPLYLETEPRQDLEVGWVSGACMLLRREAVGDAIFDERFFLYGEDVELCDRLARGGWKVVYTPRASIVHHEGKSLAGQTPEIQLSKLRGLRDIFSMRHSRMSLAAYDVVVSLGFLLRSVLFTVAALTPAGERYEAQARRSRHFLAEALRALTHR